jgi:hypothetical protein
MDTTQTQPNQQLDPTIVNMARSIKSVETNGQSNPYTAVGGSGEYGAYQYTPATWATDSAKYLGQSVPLQGASIAQQNQVAYGKIKDLKSQGYNPAQIASIWNSGKPDPTGNVGTNKYGVGYNTPQYVQNVIKAYDGFKSGSTGGLVSQAQSEANGGNQGQNNASQSPQNGLGGELEGRLNTIGTSLSDLGTQLSGQKGSQNWWSDLLHVGGSVAGGVGDIINAGLNLIPGVSNAENWVGGQVGKLADTQTGQAVVKSIQGFQQAHPELSQDIGDVANIATLIPMVKGIGMVGDSVLGSTLKNLATKGVMKAVTEQTGESLSKDAASTMVEKNLMPNIVKTGTGYAYDTTGAISKITSLKDFPPGILTALRKLNGKEYIPGKISKLIHATAGKLGGATGAAIGGTTHGIDGGLLGMVAGKYGGDMADKAAQSALVSVKNKALKSGSKSLLKRAVNVGLGSGTLIGGATSQRLANGQQ